MARMLNAWVAALLAAAPTASSSQPVPRWATLADAPASPSPDATGFVTSAGASLYYATFNPNGRSPVILLHGGLGSSRSWGFEIPLLARRHEVIVVDSRGHGRSSRPAGPLHYEQMAADVIAVMDALHIAKASIVGASDGGIIGLILAIRYPARVNKIFVWGANFNTHGGSTAPPDSQMQAAGLRYMARMEEQYRAASPSPDGFPALRSALKQLYANEPNLSADDLGRIRAPTMIADGDHEQFIPRRSRKMLKSAAFYFPQTEGVQRGVQSGARPSREYSRQENIARGGLLLVAREIRRSADDSYAPVAAARGRGGKTRKQAFAKESRGNVPLRPRGGRSAP
jgi:pimeloyl-ACP methyl ester carboxylesterase